jgi:hypothetical protein
MHPILFTVLSLLGLTFIQRLLELRRIARNVGYVLFCTRNDEFSE